jgi:hypothetical protein
MPYSDSRYADGHYYYANDPRSNLTRISVDRQFPITSTKFHYYVWVEGDRIDLVSANLYGSEENWWNIMDINPEISDPLNILPGTTIRIPNA